MTDSTTVAATEFSRNFARYQDEAIAGGTIKITSHGRVIGGYISARELARFEQLKRREREVLVVGELPDDIIADLTAAEYGVVSG